MISKEQFEEWLEDPVTEYVMGYLKDSIKEEKENAGENVVSGSLYSENEQIMIATQCVTLQHIIDITLDEIKGYYDDRSTGEQDYH